METAEQLKAMVREKYGAIAGQSREENAASCCGASCGCATVDYEVFAEDYEHLKGYAAEADLGLGCGLPTEFARIKEGDTVVDLGSGAGNDCFIARAIVGGSGKVIGVDMTEQMVGKARENAVKLGYNNVEFRLGDIENLPVGAGVADVVVSNCVLNLVPDKRKAFAETFRILKNGGHFSVSDVVTEGALPEGLRGDAELYAGCIAGAISLDEYIGIIRETGFKDVIVQKKRVIELPPEILNRHLTSAESAEFQRGYSGIFSVTVYAEKPCCEAGSGCC